MDSDRGNYSVRLWEDIGGVDKKPIFIQVLKDDGKKLYYLFSFAAPIHTSASHSKGVLSGRFSARYFFRVF